MGNRSFERNLANPKVLTFGAVEGYQYVAGDPAAVQKDLQAFLGEREQTHRNRRVASTTAQIVDLLDELIGTPEIPTSAKAHYQQAIGQLGLAGLDILDDSAETHPN